MSATLPTNWNPNHAPTGTELGQLLNAVTRITNWGRFWSTSCSLSTTSGTYVDITNFSMSFTKSAAAASSDLMFLFMFGWRTGTAPTSADFAVQINGTDYQVSHQEITSTANAHFQTVGMGWASSVPAGSYTVKGRAKRSSGAGSVTSDSQDVGALFVFELPL